MKDNIRLLLVEDEETLAGIVADTLGEKGFDVTVARHGEEALRIFDTVRPDVLVTDIMMPCMDGYTLLRRLRERGIGVPTLFLSARSTVEDVVQGFETGGNDYLRKPFAMSELIVRVRALAGRGRTEARSGGEPCRLGSFRFDPARGTLTRDGRCEELSHREAEVLRYLCRSRGEVVPNRAMLLGIWGDDSFFNTRSLHVFISHLRRRLAADPSVQIVNARGVGYKLLA